ncbi:MAG TPA: interleukin-like EMT inducer domain-containing protein, partial [Anaerolineae bacterium]
WWLKFSLLNLGQSPLETAYTYFPVGIRLTTYTFNLFNAAFGLPLQLVLSLPPASNLTLLFSYVSSAYGAFLLSLFLIHGSRSVTLSFTGSLAYELAAFAAGVVFAFSASRMMYVALGHYNFVTIQWFPFFTLFLLKALRHHRLKNSLLTALFAAFCIYAELTYSVFLIFITVIILTNDVLTGRRKSRRSGNETRLHVLSPPTLTQRIYSLLLIGLFTLLFTAPFTLAVLPDFLDPAYDRPGWGEGLKLSADLVGLVTLTPLHPLAGVDWVTELRAVIEGTGRFNDANTLFLGYGILILAGLGTTLHRKAGRVWLWSVIIFTALSLGPLLTINGQNRFDLDGVEVTYPLPFALLHYLPIINANRVPNRFGIPLTLSMAVLVGYGIARINEKIIHRLSHKSPGSISDNPGHSQVSSLRPMAHQNPALLDHPSPTALRVSRATLTLVGLNILLLVVLLFDQYSVPLPLTDARIPQVYYDIGAEPDDFTLMQLPLGWRNSYGTLGAERTQIQYYQAAHQRPMLGGNTSRNPAFKFDYYAHIPLFKALTEAELYRSVDDSILEQARSQAANLMTLYNVKYLIIHDPIPHRKPYEDTFLATRKLALDLIPMQAEPTYQSPGVEVYAVEQAPIPDPLQLDFGDWTGDPYRGEGWSDNEEIFAATANWATAEEAVIFFPVQGDGDRRLAMQIAPFNAPGLPPQVVTLSLNGSALNDHYSLREGWQVIETILSKDQLRQGLNRLELHFAHQAQPRQVLPAHTAIGQTGVDTPVDIEINSSSDFAFITVGFGPEATDASAHRRGLNVAVIQPRSGQVLEAQGFDTATNAFEAAALVDFIDSIPVGQIVIVATQGPDAANFLNTEALTALQTLGLNLDTPVPPWSAVGLKGATSGAALHISGGDAGTAYLRLGAVPDDRTLAAAVDWVTVSRP